jgi:hypothetical protein
MNQTLDPISYLSRPGCWNARYVAALKLRTKIKAQMIANRKAKASK